MYCAISPYTCTEVDCGTLTRPRDGRVVLSGTLPGSTATYTCNDGFELEGTSVATCGSDGEWSGNRPFCSGIQYYRCMKYYYNIIVTF